MGEDEEEEDKTSVNKIEESDYMNGNAGASSPSATSGLAGRRPTKTTFLTENRPSIAKTVSIDSTTVDVNEIKNADTEVTPPASATNFKRADSLASAKLAAVIALTSKIKNNNQEQEPK